MWLFLYLLIVLPLGFFDAVLGGWPMWFAQQVGIVCVGGFGAVYGERGIKWLRKRFSRP